MRFSLVLAFLNLTFSLGALALTDSDPHKSPNGKFLIANVGDTATGTHYFELRHSDGSVLFSLQTLKDFEMPSFAEDIHWSESGEFVALSVSTGKYLHDTLVIATASGVPLKIPTDDSDYQTRPVRWTKRGELIVETKAPYGGKADDDHGWARYQFRRTFRIRANGAKAECVYTSPVVYPYRAELLREGYKPRRDTKQPGTGQPATRPVVEPVGGDKPQPQAEGRSR